MDIAKSDKIVVAERKDVNDEDQTIKLVKPTEPEAPTTTTPKKTVIPKTGDATNILLPSALLAVAAACFVYVIRRRKKH